MVNEIGDNVKLPFAFVALGIAIFNVLFHPQPTSFLVVT